jgi:hypothetical protein
LIRVERLENKVDRLDTKLNHFYEPVLARHIEKWAQEIWQFDAIEGASSYVFCTFLCHFSTHKEFNLKGTFFSL